MKPAPVAFGPEVLLVFVGHADDADAEAAAVLAVEADLRRAVEQLVAVAGSAVPYRTLRLWEWNRDAPPGVGGQAEVITPILDRADVAVFVFKGRVGPVTWAELERFRTAGRPVLAFFPDAPPPGKGLKDAAVAAAWLDLVEKQRALTDGSDAPGSRAVTPMPEYRDAAHLATVALDQLKVVATGLFRSRPPAPAAAPAQFHGDHGHLGYDRQPVLAHAVEDLDAALVRAFLDKPLSQEPVASRRLRRVGVADHLALLGCLTDGRPTLGAFLCFAPLGRLADKFDGCAMQLVAYTEPNRATARAGITTARGNLLELFDEGMAWLTTRAGLRRAGRVGDADRDDLEVPEIVLREVLANALVHRDYETPALRDQPTRVEVYPDRVEVTSFGDLPAAVSVEVLNADPERVSPYRRNPVVARIFQHMSHVELNASGVPRMRAAMERAGLPPPRFEADPVRNVVRVVLARPASRPDAPLVETGLPIPPEPFVPHVYVLGTPFIGRQAEFDRLDAWAADRTADAARICCLVGLGGTGKSALAWRWFQDAAPRSLSPLSGRVWWSFYQEPSFDAFATAALAYVSRRPAEEVARLPADDKDRRLIAALDREPFLVVLDGLERVAAPAARDGEQWVDRGELLRRAGTARLAGFLTRLVCCQASRALVTSRAVPTDLRAATGGPVPGGLFLFPAGLADDEVPAFWRSFGVRGSAEALIGLARSFDNHPLVLRLLAELVANYRQAPGDVDQWLRDRQASDLRGLPLARVRSALLDEALRGLTDPARAILRILAGCPAPVAYDWLTSRLVGVEPGIPGATELNAALTELEERGLIVWDRAANRYAIVHPLLRAAVNDPAV